MISTINMTEIKRALPQALIESFSFSLLNEKQIRNFANRLKYIELLVSKINSYVEKSDDQTLIFINEFELDLYINIGTNWINPDTEISPWFIHTSWMPDASMDDIGKKLRDKCFCIIKNDIRNLFGNVIQFNEWLSRQSTHLHHAIEEFYRSDNFSNAVVSILLIDFIIVELLSGISRMRLKCLLT